MFSFNSKGDFSRSFNYLNKLKNFSNEIDLNKYGERGRSALIQASPKDTGLMLSSWGYTIERTKSSVTITWTNSDIEGGCNVAILVQYGHATRGGTMVSGIDFINPAMRPIFDDIANDVWKEVSKA